MSRSTFLDKTTMGQNIGKNIEHLEHILTKQKQNDVFFQPEVIYVI